MPRLNDQQLAELLDEVSSAIEHSIPIPEALERVAEQQHGNTAKVAENLVTTLRQGASLEASFQKLELADQGQITAAIQAAAQTGKPDLLYRFAETLRSRHDAKHTIKLNWFYPCILTVLAYFLFVNSLAPLVRDNQMLIAQWPMPLSVPPFGSRTGGGCHLALPPRSSPPSFCCCVNARAYPVR